MVTVPTPVSPEVVPGNQVWTYRYYVFAVLALSYIMTTFHRVSGAAIAGDLSKTFSIDAASLGLLTALYFYPYAAMQIPIGIMSDRLGARRTTTLFMIVAGIGALLFATAPSYGWVLLGRALVGAGVGCVYVPTLRVLSTWFRRQEFATIAGILMATGQCGSLLATQPLALVNQAWGWRTAFLGIGLITLAIAGLVYLIARDRPQEKGLPALVKEEVDPRSVPLRKSLRAVIGNGHFRWLALAFFCYGGASLSFQGLWAGPYLVDVYGLTKVAAGSILAAMPLGMLLSMPLAGQLSDRVFKSRHKVVIMGVLLLAATWFVLTFGNWAIPKDVMYGILFAFGFGNGFFMVCVTQVKELFPVEIAGTALGLYNVMCFLGAGLFQQTLGFIIRSYSQIGGVYPPQAYRTAFTVCLVAMIVSTISVLSARETPPRKA